MKNLVRVCALLLFVGAIGLTSSCKKDKCYTCSEVTDPVTGDVLAAEFTICDDETGSGLTMSAHELLGGTCTEN